MAELKPKGDITFLDAVDLQNLIEAIDAASDNGIGSFHWRNLKVRCNDSGVHSLVVQPVD